LPELIDNKYDSREKYMQKCKGSRGSDRIDDDELLQYLVAQGAAQALTVLTLGLF
jgi:hypothetical protein